MKETYALLFEDCEELVVLHSFSLKDARDLMRNIINNKDGKDGIYIGERLMIARVKNPFTDHEKSQLVEVHYKSNLTA